jgi:hypothetical protein
MTDTYHYSADVQCVGKFPFKDRPTADATIKNKREVALQAYRCTHCGMWHVGHVQKHYRRKSDNE